MAILSFVAGAIIVYIGIRALGLAFGWARYWLDNLDDWLRPPRR